MDYHYYALYLVTVLELPGQPRDSGVVHTDPSPDDTGGTGVVMDQQQASNGPQLFIWRGSVKTALRQRRWTLSTG